MKKSHREEYKQQLQQVSFTVSVNAIHYLFPSLKLIESPYSCNNFKGQRSQITCNVHTLCLIKQFVKPGKLNVGLFHENL